jgi:ABC-type transport system involved in multi-copper enzyme maturation permease subunit
MSREGVGIMRGKKESPKKDNRSSQGGNRIGNAIGHSLRGPTKDYRKFKGEYRDRNYRFYRIVVTNLKQMASSGWSIAVMVISFLFLFFHILTLVFGGSQENLLEQFDNLDPEVLFEIEPVEGQTGRVSVLLNETYTLSYRVRNTGNDENGLNIFILLPNSNWYSEYWIEGQTTLGKGESAIVHINVTIPTSVEKFAAEGQSDIFRSLGYSGWMDHEKVVYSRPFGQDIPNIPKGSETTPANAVYSTNTSRIVGIVAVPDHLLEEIADYGLDLIDMRIRSTGTLLMLDPSDPAIQSDLGLENVDFKGGLRIWMGSDDEKVYRKSMKAPQTKIFRVNIMNTGTSPLEVELDGFVMPVTSFTWQVSFFENGREDLTDQVISIDPGQKKEMNLLLTTGEEPYRVPYSILVTATDIDNGSFQLTDAYHMTIAVKGSSYADDEPGEIYHNILWGGGFNYERYLWLILLSAFAGAGVIARDLQENSIALYLSRPITWYDYLLAKFTSLLLLLSAISLFPASILFATGMAFSTNDLAYIFDNLHILGGMLISYTATLMIFGSVCMAFSTMVRKWIYAGVGIFVFFIFTSTISNILLELFDNDFLILLNLNLVMKNLWRPLFGLDYSSSSTGLEWYWLLATLSGIVIISWTLVIIRFRKREVAR